MFEEIKKKIEEEFAELCRYSDECYQKKSVLRSNTRDEKLLKIGAIGGACILPNLFLVGSFIGQMSLAYPLTVDMVISLILSGVIGSVITPFFTKRDKELLNKKTNEEILENSMYYGIEEAKAENKKLLLKIMHKKIESKENIFGEVEDDFSSSKDLSSDELEKLKKKEENLSRLYNKKLKELDILVMQKFLKNKFEDVRTRKRRIGSLLEVSFYVSMLFSFLLGIPLGLEWVTFDNLETIFDFVKCMSVIYTPTIVVFPISALYFNRRNKERVNVFNRLNDKLGKDRLDEYSIFDYDNKIDECIASKNYQIVELGVKLGEITHLLQNVVVEKNSQEKEEINTKTIEICPQLNVEDEELYIEKSGPKLVRKLNYDKRK